MTLHRTALAAAIGLALLAVPAGAQLPPVYIPVQRFAEVATGSWRTSAGVSAEYVSWTLPAGVRYTGIVINARLHAVGGTGTGTAYLYSTPGSSGVLTASATLVATAAVSVTDTTPDSSPYYAPTSLFTNLTLAASDGPVTYYLLLVPSNASLAWSFGNAASTYTAAGVTANPDQGSTSGVASPPSGSNWSPLAPNGMVFEVGTFTPPTPVAPLPAPSTFSLLGAALLIAGSGRLLLKRLGRRDGPTGGLQ